MHLTTKTSLLGFMLALLLSNALVADVVKLKPNHPERHVVVKGDTLWDISEFFLDDPWLWPEIWHINSEIENPHLIYPGDIIVLVFENGKPKLIVERALPLVKLSPNIRVTQREAPIATIPAEAISQFLLHPRILTQEEIDQSGYILAGAEGRLISGSHSKVYARGVDKTQQRFDVYRMGKEYLDPDSGDSLGFEAIFVAKASLMTKGDPTTLTVSKTKREVLIGDRVLPSLNLTTNTNFFPHPPKTEINGKIIAALDGLARIGRLQTIVINKGKNDGIDVGQVLAVYKKGAVIKDTVGNEREKVSLPDEKAGLVMVVKTFDRASYALVMKALRDISLMDDVKNP